MYLVTIYLKEARPDPGPWIFGRGDFHGWPQLHTAHVPQDSSHTVRISIVWYFSCNLCNY
jgi:hypothetical protein